MDKKQSTKYLGNILSTRGGISDNIEDRRGIGWGKISTIMGILGSVDMGIHKLEAGLLLRQAILINSLLYSAEAWSGLTDRHLARLEVVDTALLRRLTGGHAKCASEFYHLEAGTWMLRHHLTYRRLMYHHHLVTREENETIKKIYYKQKEKALKRDWYQLVKTDFEFIGKDIIDEEIKIFSKSEYKKHIKLLINKAVFQHYITLKEGHNKLDELSYTELKMQSYLSTKALNNEEKELLFNLRSKCHSAKNNFRKMNRNNINCVLECPSIEDQRHVFLHCRPVLKLVNHNSISSYEDIFDTLQKQVNITKLFFQIEQTRNHIKKKHLLPGGGNCQDPCTFGYIPNGAADFISF
jgi:hypothetical protein